MPSALSWSPAKHTKVRCWLQGVLRTILLRRLSAGLQAVEETKADDNYSDLGGGNELKDASLRTGVEAQALSAWKYLLDNPSSACVRLDLSGLR